MKLCVNCKHYENRQTGIKDMKGGYTAICAHPQRLSPVDGTAFRLCLDERRDICGEHGELFEQRKELQS